MFERYRRVVFFGLKKLIAFSQPILYLIAESRAHFCQRTVSRPNIWDRLHPFFYTFPHAASIECLKPFSHLILFTSHFLRATAGFL